jgi:hypothetical protein
MATARSRGHTALNTGAPPDDRLTTEILVWALDHARQQTLTLVADITEERACQQSIPGERHPVWILGHLLLGDVYLLSLLNAAPLSDDFPTLLRRYGPGATPTSAPGHYDTKPTLVNRLSETGAHRLDVIRRLTPVELARATPDASLAQAQPTVGHHLQALVCHEGYHAGQLSAWRRGHGLEPTPWAFAPTGA